MQLELQTQYRDAGKEAKASAPRPKVCGAGLAPGAPKDGWDSVHRGVSVLP